MHRFNFSAMKSRLCRMNEKIREAVFLFLRPYTRRQ